MKGFMFVRKHLQYEGHRILLEKNLKKQKHELILLINLVNQSTNGFGNAFFLSITVRIIKVEITEQFFLQQ